MAKRTYKAVLIDLIALHEEVMEFIQANLEDKMAYAKSSHKDMMKRTVIENVADNLSSKANRLLSIRDDYKRHEKAVIEMREELESLK